jgi:hypothetical protein
MNVPIALLILVIILTISYFISKPRSHQSKPAR